jgi:hypothetical protein
VPVAQTLFWSDELDRDASIMSPWLRLGMMFFLRATRTAQVGSVASLDGSLTGALTTVLLTMQPVPEALAQLGRAVPPAGMRLLCRPMRTKCELC